MFSTAFGPIWPDWSDPELSWLGGGRLGVLSDGRGLLGYQISVDSGGLSALGRMPLPALPAKITTLLSPKPGGSTPVALAQSGPFVFVAAAGTAGVSAYRLDNPSAPRILGAIDGELAPVFRTPRLLAC